jgi:hypothetical protein
VTPCEVFSLAVESQRDSVSKPRVARNELPWVIGPKTINPNGVAPSRTSVSVSSITAIFRQMGISLGRNAVG